MNEYPECEKLNSLSESRAMVSEFLEWVRSGGLALCELRPNGKYDHEGPCQEYFPVMEQDDFLVLRYLGIDSKKIESERRAMFAAFRAQYKS